MIIIKNSSSLVLVSAQMYTRESLMKKEIFYYYCVHVFINTNFLYKQPP